MNLITKSDIKKTYQEYKWPAATTYYEDPIVLERGEGMHVWDEDGKQYLDCFGGVLTVSVGHCHPDVTEAVVQQQRTIVHTSALYINKPITKLSEKLAEITPGDLKKSFFTSTGSEADETAIVLARLHTGSNEIICLRHSYSGRTTLAMSMAGHSTWRIGGSMVPGIHHAPAPYCYRCPYGQHPESCDVQCAKEVEEIIQTSTGGTIAAFIVEPIMGVGGFITPPAKYFQVVHEIVKRYGGLFIADEVQTGWGRTGNKWFGIEHTGATPDIMTSAKGMANGQPIGWTITTEEIAKSYPTTTFATFGGNPVSTTAASATINVIEQNDLRTSAAEVGGYLRQKLEGLKEKYSVIGDVRGKGLMQALELIEPDKAPNKDAVTKVFEETKKQGVLIGRGGLWGNVIRLGPPLIATKSDMDVLVDALDKALARV